MDASTRNLLLVGALLCGMQATAASPKAASHDVIDFSAQPVDIDYKNKIINAHKVRIVQGNMVLTADQGQANGTGVENAFDNSHWVFHGTVKITLNGAALNADEAEVTFKNKELSVAQASGKPANFQQKIANSDKTALGHADNIDYNVATGVIHLSKNAWLSDGPNELHGESLKYDLLAQTIRADAAEQNNQRVHIIITPPPPKPQNQTNP